MNYNILPYSYHQAKILGVDIEPSTRKGKKIDVYQHNNYICSVGAINYGDYPHYLEEKGKEYAENRRRLYKIRHQKNRTIVGSCGFFADKLLW